jgi:glycosyltransferase involved in cell wall biosynthesis
MFKVAAIHYSYYPQDPRPRREAEALVESGMSVDVICLQDKDQPANETIAGVEVHRIPMSKNRSSKLRYVMQYMSFIWRSSLKLLVLYSKKRHNIIHVHNMPDILVFTALFPKVCGCKVVLDLHDPMPELFITKYYAKNNGLLYKTLVLLEKLSVKFADLVVTPNISFRNLFITRGCPAEKIFIIMNSPQEQIFNAGEGTVIEARKGKRSELIMMFHGGIYERNGLDTAVEAIASIQSEIPNIIFNVYGEGDYIAEFTDIVNKYGMNSVIKYYGSVPLEKIAEEIKKIDVGIIPNRKSPFTDLNMPVRIFEYLSLNKPVIVPRTQGILDYFGDDSIIFFEPGNAKSMTDAIVEVYRNPDKTAEITRRGTEVYLKNSWIKQKELFVELIVGLGR